MEKIKTIEELKKFCDDNGIRYEEAEDTAEEGGKVFFYSGADFKTKTGYNKMVEIITIELLFSRAFIKYSFKTEDNIKGVAI